MSSVFIKIYLAICLFFQVTYSVTDTLFYTSISNFHNVGEILGILFALIAAIHGLLKGVREGWINIICVAIILATYVHDVFLLYNIVYNPIGKLCYIGTLLFALLMMVIIAQLNERYRHRLETSELAFLQAQIKPHFIFNTINTLITLTYEDVEKTRMLMIKFSQYLRNSFDFTGTDQYISFEKDMEYVTAFVEIEKVRFEGRFEIEYDIDNDIHAKVPILILQPVIENAIVHGVLQSEKYGHVWVSVKIQSDHLAFCVKDDGVGFDQKQWDRTRMIKAQKRIGLLNIDNRLKKLTEKGLTIKSEIGVGTQVSWNIPIRGNRKQCCIQSGYK
jgi:Putative regulator of cell autolysis